MNKNYISYLTYTQGGVKISFLMEGKKALNNISIAFFKMKGDWLRTDDEEIELWDNPDYIFNMFLWMDEEIGSGKIAYEMWKNNPTTPEEWMDDNPPIDALPRVDKNQFGKEEWDDLVNICIEAKTNPYDIYEMLYDIYADWIKLPTHEISN